MCRTISDLNSLSELILKSSTFETKFHIYICFLHCNLIYISSGATLTRIILVIIFTTEQSIKKSFLATAESKVHN